MPMLRAMHAEARGVGFVIEVRQRKWWAPTRESTWKPPT
jgi:hypothetical protein